MLDNAKIIIRWDRIHIQPSDGSDRLLSPTTTREREAANTRGNKGRICARHRIRLRVGWLISNNSRNKAIL